MSNTNLIVASKTSDARYGFVKLCLLIAKRTSWTSSGDTSCAKVTSAADGGGASVARVSRLTGFAASQSDILVLSVVATQLAVSFFGVFQCVGAVLNDGVCRTSFATLLASQIIVRVARAHFAVFNLVVVHW